jgi:hypothetical protein
MGIIYVFWTGENTMTSERRDNLAQLTQVSDSEVVLVTIWNLHEYILPEHPLHPGYEYLSETHKADYLRAYVMHFYGGGYSDVKGTTGSWRQAFDTLEQSDAWICGYKEVAGGSSGEMREKWNELIGNGAYICKPGTPLTKEWYSQLNAVMDSKLEQLILHPASSPDDREGTGSGYPIVWDELLGKIFHKVCYTYKEKVLRTLPFPRIWIIDAERGVAKLLHA